MLKPFFRRHGDGSSEPEPLGMKKVLTSMLKPFFLRHGMVTVGGVKRDVKTFFRRHGDGWRFESALSNFRSLNRGEPLVKP